MDQHCIQGELLTILLVASALWKTTLALINHSGYLILCSTSSTDSQFTLSYYLLTVYHAGVVHRTAFCYFHNKYFLQDEVVSLKPNPYTWRAVGLSLVWTLFLDLFSLGGFYQGCKHSHRHSSWSHWHTQATQPRQGNSLSEWCLTTVQYSWIPGKLIFKNFFQDPGRLLENSLPFHLLRKNFWIFIVLLIK